MSTEPRPRILVVDDTEAVRYATSHVLRGAGFDVAEAGNGAEALDAVRGHRPDLVVLDVKLPDISGFEVCKRLKSDIDTSSISVLHVSAMCVDSGSKVFGLGLGADAYLTHPVSDEELLATINALLRIRRAEEEARKQAKEAQAVRKELQSVLAALREKNHTLEALVQACPLAIIALDVDGRVTAWNSTASRMFGWSEEEVRGRSLPTIVSEPSATGDIPEDLACQGERLYKFQTVRQTKSGHRMPVSISAAPLYAADGQLQGTIIVASDETNRKIADEALRHHEALVSSGRMAAALAHEINNPLSAVLNVLYLLRQRADLEDSVSEYLRIADAQLSRVAQITNQVLSVHRQTGDHVEVHISEIIDAALSLYTLHLREQEIHVRRDYDARDVIVSSPGDVRQVVSNLIGNAVEALGRSGVLVVRARERLHAGRAGIRLTVADTGPGISREHLKRVLEPFFTTKGEKGTGLGLWIVNGIVNKHGGSLRFRTATHGNKRGTCFSVFLPQSPGQLWTERLSQEKLESSKQYRQPKAE